MCRTCRLCIRRRSPSPCKKTSATGSLETASPTRRDLMYKIIAVAALIALAAWAAPELAAAGTTPAPVGAHEYIGYPNDGQVVAANKPFRVWFGLRFMGVA